MEIPEEVKERLRSAIDRRRRIDLALDLAAFATWVEPVEGKVDKTLRAAKRAIAEESALRFWCTAVECGAIVTIDKSTFGGMRCPLCNMGEAVAKVTANYPGGNVPTRYVCEEDLAHFTFANSKLPQRSA